MLHRTPAAPSRRPIAPRRRPGPSLDPPLVWTLVLLLVVVGCAPSRTLSDPRDASGENGAAVGAAGTGAAGAHAGPVEDSPGASDEADGEDLEGGTGDEESGVLPGEQLIESMSVLVDSLDSPGTLEAEVPDISDSLAALTEARVPTSEEIFDYPVVLNRRVLTWIDLYTGNSRRSFENSLRRSGRYLPMARRIFAEEGVPQDLAFLAHVESGFRFNARSPKRALGLWQFMRGTATDYGLRSDGSVEERLDPEKSTRTAARYLRVLHERYDDWLLALAAYNAGPGKVDRAIQKTGSRDFWEIARTRYLRNETRNFVPAILAATILSKSPGAYGLTEDTDPPLEYETIRVRYPTDLRIVAACAEASFEELRDLNPALLQHQTPSGAERYEVRVPPGKAERTTERLSRIPAADRLVHHRHVVRSGDTLGALARKYGTTVGAIQSANGLGKSTVIRVGKTLKVPSRGASLPEELLASLRAEGSPSSSRASGAEGDEAAGPRAAASPRDDATAARGPEFGIEEADGASTHTVRKGDSLYSIARRHGVDVRAIVEANRILDASRIHPGQVLEIPGRAEAAPTALRASTDRWGDAEPSKPADPPGGAEPSESPDPPGGAEPSKPTDPHGGTEPSWASAGEASTAGISLDSEAPSIVASRAEGEAPPVGTSLGAAEASSVGTGLDAEEALPAGASLAAETSGPPTPVDTAATLGRVESTAHLVEQARAELRAYEEQETAPPLPDVAARSGASPSAPGSSVERPGVHVVRSGDTLSGVARRYGVGLSDLRSWNGLGTRSVIRPGQELRLGPRAAASEATRHHVVARGDTLWGIARSYGVSVGDLLRWNDLSSRSRIYPGQELRIF